MVKRIFECLCDRLYEQPQGQCSFIYLPVYVVFTSVKLFNLLLHGVMLEDRGGLGSLEIGVWPTSVHP